MNQDNIKKKIAALLNKTEENGATEAESLAAISKAQQLMTEYYISKEDLQDIEITEQIVTKSVNIIKIGYNQSYFYTDLGNVFDCFNFYNKTDISFVGFEKDVDLCIFFYEQIIKSLKNDLKIYKQSEDYHNFKKYYHGRRLVANFVKGYLYSLSQKLQTIYENRNSTIPEGMGLILIEKKQKVDEFAKENCNVRFVKNHIKISEQSAFSSGREKGEQFDLQQGLNEYENSVTALN